MEETSLKLITALKPMLEEKQAKLVAGSFHSLAELLLQVIDRLEKQNKEAHADNNDQ